MTKLTMTKVKENRDRSRKAQDGDEKRNTAIQRKVDYGCSCLHCSWMHVNRSVREINPMSFPCSTTQQRCALLLLIKATTSWTVELAVQVTCACLFPGLTACTDVRTYTPMHVTEPKTKLKSNSQKTESQSNKWDSEIALKLPKRSRSLAHQEDQVYQQWSP